MYLKLGLLRPLFPSRPTKAKTSFSKKLVRIPTASTMQMTLATASTTQSFKARRNYAFSYNCAFKANPNGQSYTHPRLHRKKKESRESVQVVYFYPNRTRAHIYLKSRGTYQRIKRRDGLARRKLCRIARARETEKERERKDKTGVYICVCGRACEEGYIESESL